MGTARTPSFREFSTGVWHYTKLFASGVGWVSPTQVQRAGQDPLLSEFGRYTGNKVFPFVNSAVCLWCITVQDNAVVTFSVESFPSLTRRTSSETAVYDSGPPQTAIHERQLYAALVVMSVNGADGQGHRCPMGWDSLCGKASRAACTPRIGTHASHVGEYNYM